MSDLISRSELIYKIRGIVPGSQDADFIVGLIENQPTAFDTEKVVEQLEEKIEITWEHDYRGGRKDAFNEAIDIVKKGGVE